MDYKKNYFHAIELSADSLRQKIGLDLGPNIGSGLKITVARYKTPEGNTIPAAGIPPNEVLSYSDKDTFTKSSGLKADPWIKAAVKHLQ